MTPMLTKIGMTALQKWLAGKEKQIAADYMVGGDMADLRIVFRQMFNRWPKEQ